MQAALIDCFRQFRSYLERDELVIADAAAAQAGLDWLRAAF
jgi:hypothetical protein